MPQPTRRAPDRVKKPGPVAATAEAPAPAEPPRSTPAEPQGWPADRTERRPVSGLIPYARNARTHSEEQVAQIAASIREWGWTMPVLVDERDEIIAGHGRVLAAQRLGLNTIPVMVARGWTDAQKRAYVIADNKLTLNAGWDAALLTLELGDLKSAGFDLGLTGFLDGEVKELFARQAIKAGLTDPDAAPEPPADPTSRLGDVWILGKHRLACGDCTSAPVVERCLSGAARPLLMVTDPPYGVDYDPRWRLEAGVNKPHQVRAEGVVQNDHRADWSEAWALFPGDVAYVWHGGLHSSAVERSLEAARLRRALADHLGEGLAGDRARPLSLATRAVLVCRARRRHRALARRPQAVDRLAHPQRPSHAGRRRRRAHQPLDAKAGRGDAAADAQQQPRRRDGLRAVLWLRHDDHRGRNLRAPGARG